ncbi:helix-turn-helix transcriptional regulator [Dysosmobacter sp.]|uniref:helix-turn-helix transcriptional regulator n=1 Tax=Dysosmobacter sp. TaxID=2591382 RepID=UPI002A8F1627|nr:AraC family transcriptional regulator [Dysosmobacter sp.]MDY3280851.1 AraC family transcriptional regulator [Dysosmobacter sp.]
MPDAPYFRCRLQNQVSVTELVTIHYFEYGRTYVYPGERHDFWEIMYMDRGSVRVTCGEQAHLLSRGELILLPPNVFHDLHTVADTPSNMFIVSFSEENGALAPLGGRILRLTAAARDLIRDILRLGEATFLLPMTRADRRRLQRLPDAPFGGEQLLRLRLEELLILLLLRQDASHRSSAAKARYDDDIAGRVMALLKENVYRRLTLSDVTAAMGYGKTYLSNVFQRVYGRSIMDCYTQLKLNEAKFLLRQGSMTVSQISDCLGFSSPQYFSKRFSQVMHMSPRQYASSVREDWTTTVE